MNYIFLCFDVVNCGMFLCVAPQALGALPRLTNGGFSSVIDCEGAGGGGLGAHGDSPSPSAAAVARIADLQTALEQQVSTPPHSTRIDNITY